MPCMFLQHLSKTCEFHVLLVQSQVGLLTVVLITVSNRLTGSIKCAQQGVDDLMLVLKMQFAAACF